MIDNGIALQGAPQDRWPSVDAVQMRDVDDRMEQEFGVDLTQMMENAGRSLAWLALRRYSPNRVLILAGAGGNGGGGLVAARHLANRAVDVEVALAVPSDTLDPVPTKQLQTLQNMGVPVAEAHNGRMPSDALSSDLVIDAMVGYSLSGNPRESLAAWIDQTNDLAMPVLSLDVPTGFDAHAGILRQPCVDADATLTIAFPKRGLFNCEAAGEIFVADISVPLSIYRDLGSTEPESLFAGAWVVAVDS
jgi:NAD(P)H-hydrate epimerase